MIYLDNAATTYPKPKAVIDAMTNAFIRYGANPGRSGHSMSLETGRKIYECRESAKEMFNAENPENVIFTMNCTHSINLALKGFLEKGDHVITSNFEHNAVMRPLNKLKNDKIISYDVAKVYPYNDELTLKSFEQNIRPSTKLIVCMQASNVFGITLPIEKIGKLAKKHKIKFIVDAAQSAGIMNIDMQKMNIDALCMPGHKGLYGPTGTGLLILGENNSSTLNTIVEGGTGSLSADLNQPDFLPDMLESGTLNTHGIIGLNSGIKFIQNIGAKRIFEHELRLAETAWQGLNSLKNTVLYTGAPRENGLLPVISFNLKDFNSEQSAELLNKNGIAVRGGYHCAISAHNSMKTIQYGTVRISFSVFSTKKDVNFFLNTIFKIANSKSV